MSQDRVTPFESPHVVLVGNGDTHLHVATQCRRLTRVGARVTLITREDFAYPDWLGGMLGGEWQREDVVLEATNIERHGGELVRSEVSRIDAATRRLTLENGRTLDYDWLSLDLPTRIDAQAVPGFYAARAVHSARADSLWALRQALETALAGARDELPSVAVLGAGPRGVEFAANLLALGERYGRRLPVTLIDSDRQPLPDACRRANRWLIQRLVRRGLRLELITTATRFEDGSLILDDASQVPADRLLIVDSQRSPRFDGKESPAMMPLGEMAKGEMGRGETASAAAGPRDPRIFDFDDATPKAMGERSARTRAEDALRRLETALGADDSGGPRHRDALRWQALNLGDLRDIAWRGNLWCRGRWVRRFKHRRDRREVARFLGHH